jgi:cardiolipin synthase
MYEPLKWALVGIWIAAAVGAAGHALINKRDSRAALGWIVVSLTAPLVGPLLYFFFGINRIRTKAMALPRLSLSPARRQSDAASGVDLPLEFSELAGISDAVSSFELTGGNDIIMLHNGEQAYPAMLREIDAAKSHVFLSTYIFETNQTGRDFIDALKRARDRGVETRVIVDGVGQLYSHPRAGKLLAKNGVKVAKFLPPRVIPPEVHINLRNHRKILITDGRVAFTGGMNIGDRHLADRTDNPNRVVDAHFRMVGPVVRQLQRVFLENWSFVTGRESDPFPVDVRESGTAKCRTLAEGPDEDVDKLLAVLIGAVSAARRQVAIMTPYFIPPRELVGALQAAALRGVEVTVILPAKNNLPFVHWASANMLWEVLQRGVRVFLQPPPFVHTKLFLVDGHYVQIGSANVDPRSLRLNFELVVEIYDREFAATVSRHFDAVREISREVTLEDVDSRSLPIRIRDGLAWLLSPYL